MDGQSDKRTSAAGTLNTQPGDLGNMPVWDLSDLYPAPQSEAVHADLKKAAAEAYLRISKDKDSVADILAMLNDPAIVFTMAPQNIMAYANFMAKTGMIKAKPDSWKDLFFPNVHGLVGS